MLDRFERFTFSIFEISRCWHKLASDVMSKYDLKGPYAIYLIVMRRFPLGVTAAQLCEICNRDKADVSRAVALMEEKGLVIRKEGLTRYRALLKLTAAGKSAADDIARSAHIAVDRAGKGVSDEDHEIFYRALDAIKEKMQQLCREGIPDDYPDE